MMPDDIDNHDTPPDKTILLGADIPFSGNASRIEALLEAFRRLNRRESATRLVLACRRDKASHYPVWNYLDQYGLVDKVEYLPYYNSCSRFPRHKEEVDVWIDRTTPVESLTADYLSSRLRRQQRRTSKLALFVTSFHPCKQEGNSRLMRIWLRHLGRLGYSVHLLYYMYDIRNVNEETRRAAHSLCDLYTEVEVSSRSVGPNRNGLNLHVDDWCGSEVLDAVASLTSRFEYDIAIVNYAFMSAAFEQVSAYTRKILITHDNFSDRNRTMIAQGYPESAWMSLDRKGEQLACERSDTIVALQDEEARHFKSLTMQQDKVVVVSPLIERHALTPPEPAEKLRVGYFGSRNWINEQNVAEYIRRWAKSPELLQKCELLVAGGVCDHLDDFVPAELAAKVGLRLLGRVDDLEEFFEQCDLVVNPERGGTGIKIKTLESLAYGVPVVSTRQGTVGIGATSRFHLATSFEELADLTLEVAQDRDLLDLLRRETRTLFSAYESANSTRLDELLAPHPEGSAVGGAVAASPPPKVSVIIPFYNVSEFIEECLESVIAQDHPDLEIICVDDCSPDDSAAKVAKFRERDSRIELVSHERNRGLGPARNTGVQYATGQYLIFLDSDDYFSDKSAISTMVNKACLSGCSVVVGSCQRLMPDSALADFDRGFDISHGGKPGEIVNGMDAFLGASFIPGGRYVPMRAWGSLIERKLYLTSGLSFPAAEHEDLALTPFLYYYAERVLYIPDIVVTYRMRSQSISNAAWSRDALSRYKLLWTCIKENIERFDLDEHMANTAIKTAEHLVMKIRNNGLKKDATPEVFDILTSILSGVRGSYDKTLFRQTVDDLHAVMDICEDRHKAFDKLVSAIGLENMIEYYTDGLTGDYLPTKAIEVYS